MDRPSDPYDLRMRLDPLRDLRNRAIPAEPGWSPGPGPVWSLAAALQARETMRNADARAAQRAADAWYASRPCPVWPGCERGIDHEGACRRRTTLRNEGSDLR